MDRWGGRFQAPAPKMTCRKVPQIIRTQSIQVYHHPALFMSIPFSFFMRCESLAPSRGVNARVGEPIGEEDSVTPLPGIRQVQPHGPPILGVFTGTRPSSDTPSALRNFGTPHRSRTIKSYCGETRLMRPFRRKRKSTVCNFTDSKLSGELAPA